nr:hypothetical protein [uncultured Albidiferax sp.]
MQDLNPDSDQFGISAEFIGINNDWGNALQHQVARNHGTYGKTA